MMQFLINRNFIEIPAFNASSVKPDQMQYIAVPDLGQHCLSVSLLLGAEHK